MSTVKTVAVAVWHWLGTTFDAKGWIALAALLVSALIWLQARRSTNVSTKSAEASSRSIKRSADAAERNAAIAEARYHDDQEPAWTCVISGVEGGCDITATFDAGPPRLDVYSRLAGHVWAEPATTLGAQGLPLTTGTGQPSLVEWTQPMSPGAVIKLRRGRPDIPDPAAMHVLLELHSVPAGQEIDSDTKRWVFEHELQWSRDSDAE